MRNGLFVTGTDTDVGKTVVASLLASAVRRRLVEAGIGQREPKVSLWKPVQTGVQAGAPDSDSARLVYGSGLEQPESETWSFTFPDPVAPWMAAQREGAHIPFHQLVEEGRERLRSNDYTLVEGAGGLAVPLTERYLIADLAASLQLPMLIVARPGLGTVNHTLMTIAYAKGLGLEPVGVILNGYRDASPALEENAMMIERFGGVPVIGKLPWLPGQPETAEDWAAWRTMWDEIIDAEVDVDRLLRDPQDFTVDSTET